MFFYASKILFFFAQPSSVVVILIAAGLLLVHWRPVAGRRLALAGLALLLIIGLSPLGNALLLPLEDRFASHVPPIPTEPIAGILILGGFEDAVVTEKRGGLEVNESAERLVEGVRLARALPNAKVVFTGGSGMLFNKTVAGPAVRQFLIDAGIDPARIVIESQSRDTYENATLTKALLKPADTDRWLLVTSAYHMPRAVGAFRAAGFRVTPYPVDFRTRGRQDLKGPFGSVAEGMKRTDMAMREWIGLVGYWLGGRSSALYPGPEEK
jgi:uncharacterized SAM-binding protein YcdF (DUF218 family)